MDIQLLIRAKDKPEKSLTIKKDVVIGRSQTCQFRVLSNDVSREHCRIVVGESSVAVRDLGSSNGTVVNGKPIPPQTDFPLNPGDTLEVGPLTVVFDFKSSVAATPRPAATAPTAAAEPKKKSASKPATASVAAAPQKVKKPKPPVASDESSIPVFSSAPERDDESADGATWSNFGEELSGDLTFDVPERANEYGLVESDGDFRLNPPASIVEPVEPQPSPTAKTSAATASDDDESFDEPFFEDADQSTESAFDFDPDQAAEPVASAPATPAAPPSPAAASSPPGKLKSLFGMFGKGKKEAAPPAKTAIATAPAPVSAAATEESESPIELAVGGGEVDDMAEWLLGGSAAPIHDEPVAIAATPSPVVAPAAKPKAAKKAAPVAAVSAPPKTKSITAAAPKAAPKAAPIAEPSPPVVAAPESENEDDFNDFFSQLGN